MVGGPASFQAHERYMDEQLKELQRIRNTVRSTVHFDSCTPLPNNNGALRE